MLFFKKTLVTMLLFACLGLLTSAKYYGSKEVSAIRELLDRYAVEVAKENGLKYLNNGTGATIAHCSSCLWAINWTSKEAMTIEQARPLVARLCYGLLCKMYHERVFAKWSRVAKSELTDNKVGFRLAFWDANVDRPLFPYLAQVRFADSKVYYHYADPQTQALQEPIVESLEDLHVPNNYKDKVVPKTRKKYFAKRTEDRSQRSSLK